MGQDGQALGDRPEPIEAQRIHGQAAERGHDLNAVDLAVAVRVFLELRVAGPVPGVLNRPAVAHVLQHRHGAGAEAGDVVTGFVDGLAVATALAADREHHGATVPVLRHPLWSWQAPQRPGEVPAAFVLVLAGLVSRHRKLDQRRAVPFGKTLHAHERALVAVGVSLPRSGRWRGSPPAASTTADSGCPGACGNRAAP